MGIDDIQVALSSTKYLNFLDADKIHWDIPEKDDIAMCIAKINLDEMPLLIFGNFKGFLEGLLKEVKFFKVDLKNQAVYAGNSGEPGLLIEYKLDKPSKFASDFFRCWVERQEAVVAYQVVRGGKKAFEVRGHWKKDKWNSLYVSEKSNLEVNGL